MSLDVWLIQEFTYPGRDGQCTKIEDVFDGNITHNLGAMAKEAGVYMYLWRPDELGITLAEELIDPLTAGLKLLEDQPERFKQFNPANGWGNYRGLVDFVRDYLNACVQYPKAVIGVSR